MPGKISKGWIPRWSPEPARPTRSHSREIKVLFRGEAIARLNILGPCTGPRGPDCAPCLHYRGRRRAEKGLGMGHGVAVSAPVRRLDCSLASILAASLAGAALPWALACRYEIIILGWPRCWSSSWRSLRSWSSRLVVAGRREHGAMSLVHRRTRVDSASIVAETALAEHGDDAAPERVRTKASPYDPAGVRE